MKLELTLLKTELVGQINEDILDFFLGKGDVCLLGPGRLILALLGQAHRYTYVWLARTVSILAALGEGRGGSPRGHVVLMLVVGRSSVLVVDI